MQIVFEYGMGTVMWASNNELFCQIIIIIIINEYYYSVIQCMLKNFKNYKLTRIENIHWSSSARTKDLTKQSGDNGLQSRL